MYKTTNTLPQKIRSKSGAALLAGLVALTALPMTPLAASAAGTTGFTAEQVKHIVAKYLKAHPNSAASSIVAGTPHGVYVGDSEHQQP